MSEGVRERAKRRQEAVMLCSEWQTGWIGMWSLSSPDLVQILTINPFDLDQVLLPL